MVNTFVNFPADQKGKKEEEEKKVQITVIMLITFFSFLGVCECEIC